LEQRIKRKKGIILEKSVSELFLYKDKENRFFLDNFEIDLPLISGDSGGLIIGFDNSLIGFAIRESKKSLKNETCYYGNKIHNSMKLVKNYVCENN